MNSRNTILTLIFIGLCMACMKDKGNYDYKPIAAISIEPPVAGVIYMKRGMPDTLRPLINYGKEGGAKIDTSAYRYTWTASVLGLPDSQLKTSKAYLTPADFDSVGFEGPIEIALEVREKATGITANKLMFVFYSDLLAEGWALLYEKNGNTGLGFLSYMGNRYRPLMGISDSLGLASYLVGKPLSIALLAYNSDAVIGVSTEQSVTVIDQLFRFSKHLTETANDQLHPSADNPVYLLQGIPGAYWQNGNIYAISPDIDGYSSNLFKPFLTATPNNNLNIRFPPDLNDLPPDLYKVSPVGIHYDHGTRWMVFDETNGRFVNPSFFESWEVHEFSPFLLNANFNMSGFKLVCQRVMKFTGTEIIGALVKNESGEFYVLTFLGNGILKSAVKVTDPRVAQANHFAIDLPTGYLLFDAGHILLGYDYNAHETRELKDLGKEKVSVMKFQQMDVFESTFNKNVRLDVYMDIAQHLVLCTYDPGSGSGQAGSFHLLKVPLGGQPLIELYKETGLPVIKDIMFIGTKPDF